jgi:hypothetical protein
MNADRLLKLANFLDNLPPERFRFNAWVGDGWECKPDLSCGTTACALGWATTIPEFAAAGLCLRRVADGSHRGWAYVSMRDLPTREDQSDAIKDPATAAHRIFDLTETEAWWLFIPLYEEDRFCEYDRVHGEHRPGAGATAKQVAAHIRDFILNGIPAGAVQETDDDE